jgi:uncharacterized membrane protein YeaQ/YmgE (transglycosylase-associated protein family)
MQTLGHLIVWVIIGLFGGSLAGLVIKWDRRGFGLLRNLAIGLVGAIIGGLLFLWFQIFPALDGIAISLQDVVSAFVGSLVVLIALWGWNRFGKQHVA